jgi:hypothetical protein
MSKIVFTQYFRASRTKIVNALWSYQNKGPVINNGRGAVGDKYQNSTFLKPPQSKDFFSRRPHLQDTPLQHLIRSKVLFLINQLL